MTIAKKTKCGRCGRNISALTRTQHRRFCDNIEPPGVLAARFIEDDDLSVSKLAAAIGAKNGTALTTHLIAGLELYGIDDPADFVSRRNKVNRINQVMKESPNRPKNHTRCKRCTIIIPHGYDYCSSCCQGGGGSHAIARIVENGETLVQGSVEHTQEWLEDRGFGLMRPGLRRATWRRGARIVVLEMM